MKLFLAYSRECLILQTMLFWGYKSGCCCVHYKLIKEGKKKGTYYSSALFSSLYIYDTFCPTLSQTCVMKLIKSILLHIRGHFYPLTSWLSNIHMNNTFCPACTVYLRRTCIMLMYLNVSLTHALYICAHKYLHNGVLEYVCHFNTSMLLLGTNASVLRPWLRSFWRESSALQFNSSTCKDAMHWIYTHR